MARYLNLYDAFCNLVRRSDPYRNACEEVRMEVENEVLQNKEIKECLSKKFISKFSLHESFILEAVSSAVRGGRSFSEQEQISDYVSSISFKEVCEGIEEHLESITNMLKPNPKT